MLADQGDKLYSCIGALLIDILEFSSFIKRPLIRTSKTSTHYELHVDDDQLKSQLDNQKMFIIPSRLPMIVPPKDYSNTDGYGGYLLNDIEYKEDLFIDKKGYKISTAISCCNNYNIYDIINNINKTPFKVNSELLDFLLYNDQWDLLLDENKPHKYAYLTKRNKLQESKYRAHNSKVVLQEIVLDIANFYRQFNELYFPVRLDQRGRLYCSAHYFNYQANELSKSLLLFSKPGIIKRNDLTAIAYLKMYGVNCFGGVIAKKDKKAKLKWVDNNTSNIINYSNGILLEKASDKLLFLAFCMEFKRFHNFISNESLEYFDSYLPIQLDASCNGFQHMALLSDKRSLFKELNLQDSAPPRSNKNKPVKDFYSFLLYRVINNCKNNIKKGVEFGKNKKGEISGSYKRLVDFIWDRSHIKKALMTVPYSVSHRSMQKYIRDNLNRVSYDEETGLSWFTDRYEESEKDVDKFSSINNKDISLLASLINHIIFHDFEKIKRLSIYLKNIIRLCNRINFPITWNLPTGLKISQSYLKTTTTSISPFYYSKTKLNFKVSSKNEYDKRKQSNALMPNLIHSLDASSLCMLYNIFRKEFGDTVQFYSIHDCFGTTADKVSMLKTLLASVYVELYSNDHYLIDFHKDIIDEAPRRAAPRRAAPRRAAPRLSTKIYLV